VKTKKDFDFSAKDIGFCARWSMGIKKPTSPKLVGFVDWGINPHLFLGEFGLFALVVWVYSIVVGAK
jgi:hypothetical protein